MNIDHEHESDEARNPSVKYDKSDLGARGILIFFLVLLVSAIAVHLCVLGLYVGMTKFADEHDPEVSPLAPKTFTPRAEILTNTSNVNVQQFPQPRLLTPYPRPGGRDVEVSAAGNGSADGPAVEGRARATYTCRLKRR